MCQSKRSPPEKAHFFMGLSGAEGGFQPAIFRLRERYDLNPTLFPFSHLSVIQRCSRVILFDSGASRRHG
jgi:hypothetical protein